MSSSAPFSSSTSTKTGVRTLGQKLKRLERRTLVAWIRYAQKHRHSMVVPFVLFGLLFCDGFLVFIPSMLLLIAATTISPQRWWIYALIFGCATAANNSLTYLLGTVFPVGTILEVVAFFKMEFMWQSAQEALQKYGSMATFVGALIGLPTQMITALIGIADAGIKYQDAFSQSTFSSAILLAFLGHSIKAFLLAGLTRFGWVKLEKKFQSEVAK